MGRARCHRAGCAYLLAGCVRRWLSVCGRARVSMHSLSLDKAAAAASRTPAREHRGFRALHRLCRVWEDRRDLCKLGAGACWTAYLTFFRDRLGRKIPADGTELLGPSCGFSRACRPEGIARVFTTKTQSTRKTIPRFFSRRSQVEDRPGALVIPPPCSWCNRQLSVRASEILGHWDSDILQILRPRLQVESHVSKNETCGTRLCWLSKSKRTAHGGPQLSRTFDSQYNRKSTSTLI